ncbi:MAG: hypothetical protein ACXAEX_16465, partial [Promethearchaeota archaeon]
TKLEWGEESTVEEALLVAKELELELKAISYVKWHVRNFIFDMRKKLEEINIPESHLDEILVEGHKFAHGELDLSTAEMIRISSKKKIKDEIIEKIVPDFQTYIS